MTFEPYIGFFSIFLFSFYLFLVLLPFVKFDVFLHLCADACRRVHFHLPYRWEVFDGISWTDVEDMEDVERDFCDPSKTQSHGDPPVHFPSMTQKLRPVRRLSTVSSVTKPLHYVLTTKWRWFYRGDGGVWVEYGEPDEKLRTMSVTSRRLEEAFLSDPSAEVLVVKGNREHVPEEPQTSHQEENPPPASLRVHSRG
ncbi:zinc finger CCCH-type antiviral protein 1-like isoform X2 [Plectropomus leopardus]|uniref:zinc finger CCCH-type antiviral protein 1-like isoform X2 n=1 Tax=Plectropomus leopardus TaxID=160734 RepID=UPI001C4AF9AD|nr:zinc finger CCCH-type antiviral protein 1-like isoform X2 [Plectropomus leopardus]